MENIFEQIMQDMSYFAEQHDSAASNEHLWALGSSGEEAVQHERNAEEHRYLANLYRQMADAAEKVVETFGCN